jgi:dihydroflavonol-4-reductase
MIASAAGVAPPKYKAPYLVALAVAHGYELASRFTDRHPVATVSELKIGRLGETYDCSKAIQELGLPQTPVQECIQRSVEWFRANGYLD